MVLRFGSKNVKENLQEEAQEIRQQEGRLTFGKKDVEEKVEEPSFLQELVSFGSKFATEEGRESLAQGEGGSLSRFTQRTTENFKEGAAKIERSGQKEDLSKLTVDEISERIERNRDTGTLFSRSLKTISPSILSTIKDLGQTNEAVLFTKGLQEVIEAPISAALSPAIESAIQETGSEKEVSSFLEGYSNFTKFAGLALNRGLNLNLNKETEGYLGELGVEIGAAGATAGITTGIKSGFKGLRKTDVDATKEGDMKNLAEAAVQEPTVTTKEIGSVIDKIANQPSTNSFDVAQALKDFGFNQESDNLFKRIKEDTLPGNIENKSIINDLLEVRKKDLSIIKKLEDAGYGKANKTSKKAISSTVSKSTGLSIRKINSVANNFNELNVKARTERDLSNLAKYSGTDEQIVSVVDMLDNKILEKVDDGLNYKLVITDEGKKVLNRNEELLNSEKQLLIDDGIKINKDRFDNIESDSSVKLDNTEKRISQMKGILDEFKTGDRDYNNFALSVADFELSRGATTTSADIIGLANKINDKYQLHLGNKINDMVDTVTGEIDKVKLKAFTKELVELRKDNFIIVAKLLKAEPRNLKQKLGIQEKLYNKLFKEGFKEGTAKAKKTSDAKIDKLKAEQKAKINKIKESDKERRAKVKKEFDDKIQTERLKTRRADDFRLAVISGLKDLGKSENYHGDITKVINKLASLSKFQKAKTDTQINAILKDIHGVLLKENVKGLNKAIQKELTSFGRANVLKGKVRGKFNAKEYELLRGYRLMFDRTNVGDATTADLQNFLDNILDLKETATKALKEKRLNRATDAASEIKIMKEEGLVSLKGDIISKGYGKKRSGKFWSLVNRYNNELNFFYRVLEEIGGGTNSKFYKTFWLDTDVAYNDYANYKNVNIDPVIQEIDKRFTKEATRLDAGSFLTSLRTKFINNKDGSVSEKFEGLEAMKADKNSALNTDRTSKAQSDVPEGLPFTQEMWEQELKNTKLGEILENAGTEDYKWLVENTGSLFNDLGDRVAKVAEEFDNIPLHRVNNYIPLVSKTRGIEKESGGFGEAIYNQNKIKNGFLEQAKGGTDIEYEYDIINLISRGANNESYYSFVRPQYERLKDIYFGRKIPKDKITKFDKESLDRLGIVEELDINTGLVTYRQKDGIGKDLGETTRASMKVFFDRLANNGDKFDTVGSNINKATAYVNNQILGLNPSTAAKQFLSMFDGGGIVGYRNLSWASVRGTQKKTQEKMLEASATLRNRFGGELSLKEIESELTGGGKISKGFAKFQKVGIAPIKYFDQVVASRIWLGAYRKFLLDNGLAKKTDEIDIFDNLEAVSFADDLMQRSVSTVNPLALPTGYRSAYTRVLGQLMSTQLNRVGILTRDIPNMFKKGDYKRGAIASLSYMVSSFGDKAITAAVGKLSFELGLSAWEGYDKEFAEILFGEDTEENLTKLGEAVVGEFVGGRAALAFFKGDDLTVIGGYMQRISKDIKKMATADDGEEALEATMKLLADSFGMYPGRAVTNWYSNQ